MGGCNNKCNFSLERNDVWMDVKMDILKSQKEYVRVAYLNSGCNKCHYEKDYPTNYLDVKRKRRFLCYNCDSNNYIKIKINVSDAII